jgi:hypothetical protein
MAMAAAIKNSLAGDRDIGTVTWKPGRIVQAALAAQTEPQLETAASRALNDLVCLLSAAFIKGGTEGEAIMRDTLDSLETIGNKLKTS